MKALAISGYIFWILIAIVFQHLANWIWRLDNFQGAYGAAILCGVFSFGIIVVVTTKLQDKDLEL